MEQTLENHKSRGRASGSSHLKPGLLIVTLAALFFCLTSARDALASEGDETRTITVLVFNLRNIPAKTLAHAENEARQIIEQAGVHITWQECPTGNVPCQRGSGRTFILAMMIAPNQNQLQDTVSGYAIPSERLAVVYYDFLPPLPGGKHDTAVILGCFIAHELGHLLLKTPRHSLTGIMRANWDPEQTRRALMSQLYFLPEESELMQRMLLDGERPINSAVSALVSPH